MTKSPILSDQDPNDGYGGLDEEQDEEVLEQDETFTDSGQQREDEESVLDRKESSPE